VGNPFAPDWLIYHDSHGSPENEKRLRMPYHVTVFPDGTVNYRDPGNPYGAPAPHAAGFNPRSLGLAYSGPSGGTPTPEGMKALQQEYEKIQARFPGMPGMGHGEAHAAHKKHPFAFPPASVSGRPLEEASWRESVGDMSNVPASGLRPLGLLPPSGEQAPPDVGPAIASASPRPAPERMALGGPKPGSRPMPYPDAPYAGMTPQEVERLQQRALDQRRFAMRGDVAPNVFGVLAALAGGVGSQMDQRAAGRGEREGQDRASQSLAAALQGGDTKAAIAAGLSNPWAKWAEPLAGRVLQNELDPDKDLNRKIKLLQIKQAEDDAAWEQRLLGGAPSQSPTPSPAPPRGAPAALSPVPGVAVAPPAAAPPPQGAPVAPQPAPAAAPRPRTQQDIRAILATRTPDEARLWIKTARKEPDKALKILDDWANPDKAQDEARKKQVGEGLGKRDIAALPPPPELEGDITKGLQELHSIPGRYGGDKGVFGSAVGALQGDPDAWGSGIARGLGSMWTAFEKESPAEVRRAIQGGQDTLMNVLKKLIRPPGSAEGPLSDADQARLDRIIGPLMQANDVAQYRRELENVRRRINENFRLNIPAFEDAGDPPAASGALPRGATKPDPLGIR
jgi:hypothetical protein